MTAQTKQIKNLQNQKAALQKELSASQKLLTTTKRDVKSQLNNLAVLNNQIGEQKKICRWYSERSACFEQQYCRLRAPTASFGGRLSPLQKALRTRCDLLLLSSDVAQQVAVVLKAKDFREMSRRLRYVSEYTRYQQMQAKIIKEKEAAVQQKKNE